MTQEKLTKYLLEILDDELMYHRLKKELQKGRTVETAIFYTMRDRDTDRALFNMSRG